MKLWSLVFASTVALAAVAFAAVDDNTNKSNTGAKTALSATTCPAGQVVIGGICVIPSPECGAHSSLDHQTNSCECDAGYALAGNSCAMSPATCPSHSTLHRQTNRCECDAGYVSASDGKSCASAPK